MSELPLILNPEGRFPGLIVVDHAGTSTPLGFGPLGLSEHLRDTHHFCDLGIASLAHALADRLDAPVILGTVSRLVIDLNRWLDDPRSIATHVEGQLIPGNQSLSDAGRKARQDQIFWPYHAAVTGLWNRIRTRHADPYFLALHSCTRHFDGQRRPWDGGTIWNESPILAHALLGALESGGGLALGDNKPYTGRNGVYTLDRHTWGSGYRACGFEVSNDLLGTPKGQADWTARLGDALASLATVELRR
ncbi:N-formylglutamate amidohydrolase [Marivita cryptomonadis]|uniref:N-formylglutamate amidohydrolase n=1 Tax=Marivita cryptomonadis TaxID=505252 RepID=UPI000A1F6415|nr:N-formylglutamate amidohydrolase [Marivita cryptomonadis]OSQ53947.1 N-formylglutamate amidohydrolase [Marivita cryptomonadis]